MFKWLRQRRANRERLREDARALITGFGAGAYDEARRRGRETEQGKLLDQERPRSHWQLVQLEIARQTGREIGLDAATRYTER